ncbi:hypothetical protein BH11MYX3_BH11MYX3_04140 [soil metagenome]
MRPALVVALLLLPACGDGIAAIDAAPPLDTNVGLVRVRYVTQHDPGGHAVFFQNADSSLVLSTRTDERGEANAFMAPGGFVTLHVVDTTGDQLYTWAGVQPGDDLQIRDSLPSQDPTTFVRLRVAADPGAVFYRLRSTCGEGDVTYAVGVEALFGFLPCRGKTDLVVVSHGETGQHYLYRGGVEIVEGGLVDLAGPYQAVDRGRVEVVGASPSVRDLSMNQLLIGARDVISDPFDGSFGLGFIELTDGAGALDFESVAPADGTLLTMIDPCNGDGVGAQHAVRWGPATLLNRFDMTALAVRPYLSRPTYDLLGHSVRWTEGAGVVPGAVIATFSWGRPEIGGGYRWRIISPRGEEPVVEFPVLPVVALRPQSGDFIGVPDELVNIASEHGYDPIRARLGTWSAGTIWPFEGTSGSAVYQDLLGATF